MRYVGKRLRRKEKRSRGLNLLLPSCLMLFACVVCLSGLTWAWFSATQSATIAPVQSATYNVTATATDTSNQDVALTDLKENTSYTIKLTADGTASTGWCKVTWNDTPHYVQLSKDNIITFTVIPTADTALTVESNWGKLPDDTIVIQPGKTFGEIISDTTDADTPAEGDEPENGTEPITPAESNVSEPPADTSTDTDETPAEDSPAETSPDESTPSDDTTAPDTSAPSSDADSDSTAAASDTINNAE